MIKWDDGQAGAWSLVSENVEAFTCYSNPELLDLAVAYYTARTGAAPETISAELGENFQVTITVNAGMECEMSFHVNARNAVGTMQDGSIVDLKILPEDTGITAFRKGIWTYADDNGTLLGAYYFDGDSTEGTHYDTINGIVRSFTYTLQGDQLVMQFPLEESEQQARAVVREDSAVMTWRSGRTVYLSYHSDETPETFRFYSYDTLSEMASAYYKAATCRVLDFYTRSVSGTSVTLRADDPEGNDIRFTVDLLTASGTDQDGAPVDLNTPVVAPGTSVRSGIWRSCTNGSINGHFIFSEDKTAGEILYLDFDEQQTFTYRLVNDHGLLTLDGNEYAFTYDAESGEILLGLDGQQYTLRFDHAGTAKDLKCYDFTRITKMALEDYKSRTGTAVKGYIASCDEEGKVEISMFIADTGEDADTYMIDLYTGLGTNQNGEAVNLPQTGNNVPGAAAATAKKERAYFAMIDRLYGDYPEHKRSTVCTPQTVLLSILYVILRC